MFDVLERIENVQESEKKVLQAYRSVFSTGLGQLVFEDMLFNLKFLQPCENEQDMALSNYAKSLIATVYGLPIESNRLRNIIKKVIRKRRRK